MHIISYKKVRDFCQKHNSAESSLQHWYRIVRRVNFTSFMDVKKVFPSADNVGNFVVFNIGGNNYRLIAYIRYPLTRLYIRHILTHDKYDRNNWKEDLWFKRTSN